MNTATISYSYDPAAKVLTIFENGKPRGCFSGSQAETRFIGLMGKDANITITNMNTLASHSMKIRCLRALWIKQGIDKYRDAILEEYGVTSTKDLTDEQLDQLIKMYSCESNPSVSEVVRKLRSEVLVLINKMGVYADNGDWQKVNDFLMDKRIAGKLMYQMTEADLKSLKRKLFSILTKHNATASDIARQQIMN